MRNLSLYSNVYANYLKAGAQPRTLVRIPDLDLDLTTTLKSSGAISRTAKPFGGYESAASLSISNLILEDDVNFCTETALARKDQGVLRGAGKALSTSAYGSFLPYATVRNATTGTITDPTLMVGQMSIPALGSYTIMRSFLQFVLPTSLTSCEEATLWLRGISKYTLTDFQIYIVLGTWTSLGTIPVYDTGLYNDLTGWAASGAYSLAPLNEYFDTSEFFAYDPTFDENERCVLLRLNDLGKQAVVDAAKTGDGILRLMLLSKKDADAAAPTTSEYVIFESSTAELKLRYNTVNLDNAEVRVYRYYGDTQPAYADMLELFRGVIDRYTITLRTMDIDIRKDERKLRKVIPSETLQAEDYVSVAQPGIDNELNFGKPIPIIYGDFTLNRSFVESIGSFTNQEAVRCENADFFKAFNLCTADISKIYNYLIYCNFDIHTLAQYVAIWNGELKSFAVLPCSMDETIHSDPGIVTIENGGANFPCNIGSSEYGASNNTNPVQSKIVRYDTSSGMTDQLNAQDADPTNWSTINAATDSWDGSTDSFGISGFDTVAFVIETYAPNGYGSNHITFNHETYDKDNNKIQDQNETINTDGQHVYYYDNHSELTSENVSVQIHITAGSPFNGSYPIYFRNIQIMRGYAGVINSEVYLTGKGRADDGSGTVTGSAGSLIENPSHVIESLARSELSLASTNIDTTGFDIAATTLTNWKLAFQLLDADEGLSVLDEIGEQSKASLFRDDLDRLAVKVWDQTKGFAHSGDDIPDDLDIFQTSYAATKSSGVETMTRNPISIESLTIDQVQIDKVYNSFEIKFRKNYATGDYREIITIDNGAGVVANVSTTLVSGDESSMENSQTIAGLKTLCAESYVNCGNTTHKLTINADYIRERATAVKLLQHHIEAYAPRRYTVELTTWENALWMEFGDRVNIRHQRIYERFGVATAYRKKWAYYSIKHTLKDGEMRIKCIEVDPTTVMS